MHTQSMSMFPHTITVYNTSIETDKATFEDKLVNHITVLRGVLVDASKAVNVRESGLVGADAVNLYIPFDVEAVDGLTGKSKQYLDPLDYWKSDDKSGFWTLSVSSKQRGKATDSDTFFVKGEVVEPNASVELIELNYDHVYDVTKIDEKDFGGLQHFEVGAN